MRSRITWILMFGAAYLFAVASDSGAELTYAILFAAAATFVIEVLHRGDGHAFALRPRTILFLGRRAFVGAVKESWLLLGPRLYAQLRGTAPQGRFIRLNIDRGRGDAEANGRVAAVLWVQAFTPNTVPLFIDRGQLVLHQLVHQHKANAHDGESPS